MNDDQKAEDWRRVKEIFYAALDKPEAERKAFVEEVCAENPAFRDEVLKMLEIEAKATDFIEKPAFSLEETFGRKPENLTGKIFGNYKILREIGRGGMGAVFLAERTRGEFEQKVALKIIRQTIADSELERRFRRERQILANLNHPNIARLLDGGVSDAGEAFLVMEFVEGKALNDFTAEQQVSVGERLKLFLKICAAVAYAHRNLVIHRDIKPGNVLVTANGEPKLLDFGLAKILNENLPDENQTATAFRAFTPAYASPEQILGKAVTTASDVYSLGVLFYELLTDNKPFHFEGKSLEEIIRTIARTEPPAPSAISNFKSQISDRKNPKSNNRNPKLHKDLDNIALKALQKDPELRYKSVEEFAADIERHLNGLPVSARPATAAYRAAKFFKRNKIVVSATILIFLSLLTGLLVTLWQAGETRRERDRAEKRFNDLRKLSNSLLFEITPQIERLEGSTAARQLLVKRALEYLDSLAGEAVGDADLQAELAAAYGKIGEIQGNPSKPNLNDFTGATESFLKANAILRKLPQTIGNRKLLAENFRQLAKARQNDMKASMGDSEEAIKIYENLIAENPSLEELKLLRLETQTELAQLHTSNSDFKTALAVLEGAIPELGTLDQTNPRVRELFVFARTQRGFALSWESRQAEAEALMAEAVRDGETLAAENPTDARIQQVLWESYYRASAIYETIRDDVSLEFAEKCVRIKQKAVEDDASDTQSKHNLARSFSRVGLAFGNLKQTAKAVENWRRAETILLELEKNQPKNLGYQADLASLYYRIGNAEKLREKLADALAAFQKALAIYERLFVSDEKNANLERHVGTSAKNIGDIFLKFADKENAKTNYAKALQILNNLKSQNKLPNYDQKLIEEMQTALQKL